MNPLSSTPAQTQDPLAELRPQHLPMHIDAWPWAMGWYLLVAFIVISTALATYLFIKRKRDNLYKRQALDALTIIKTNFSKQENAKKLNPTIQALNELLKRFYLVHLDRKRLSQLSGDKWLAFLDQASNSTDFSLGPGNILGVRSFKNLEQDPEALEDTSQVLEIVHKLIQKSDSKSIKNAATIFLESQEANTHA